MTDAELAEAAAGWRSEADKVARMTNARMDYAERHALVYEELLEARRARAADAIDFEAIGPDEEVARKMLAALRARGHVKCPMCGHSDEWWTINDHWSECPLPDLILAAAL